MRNIVLLVSAVILISGCVSIGGTGTQPGQTGSANFQRCMSQCQPGNAGSGPYCEDGCRLEEASDTKDTSWCDGLDNSANRPSCYGTVAKSAGDIKVCDRLPAGTDRNYCVSIFGGPGTS